MKEPIGMEKNKLGSRTDGSRVGRSFTEFYWVLSRGPPSHRPESANWKVGMLPSFFIITFFLPGFPHRIGSSSHRTNRGIGKFSSVFFVNFFFKFRFYDSSKLFCCHPVEEEEEVEEEEVHLVRMSIGARARVIDAFLERHRSRTTDQSTSPNIGRWNGGFRPFQRPTDVPLCGRGRIIKKKKNPPPRKKKRKEGLSLSLVNPSVGGTGGEGEKRATRGNGHFWLFAVGFFFWWIFFCSSNRIFYFFILGCVCVCVCVCVRVARLSCGH